MADHFDKELSEPLLEGVSGAVDGCAPCSLGDPIVAWIDANIPISEDEEDFGDGPEGKALRDAFLAPTCVMSEEVELHQSKEGQDGEGSDLATAIEAVGKKLDRRLAIEHHRRSRLRLAPRMPARRPVCQVPRNRERRPVGRRRASKRTAAPSRGDPDPGDPEPGKARLTPQDSKNQRCDPSQSDCSSKGQAYLLSSSLPASPSEVRSYG